MRTCSMVPIPPFGRSSAILVQFCQILARNGTCRTAGERPNGRASHASGLGGVPNRVRACAERGTVSVITAVIMMALLGSLAMVVDLGYLFGQRRLAQNAADSAAMAGAKVLALHIQYQATSPQTDAGVLAAISDIMGNS